MVEGRQQTLFSDNLRIPPSERYAVWQESNDIIGELNAERNRTEVPVIAAKLAANEIVEVKPTSIILAGRVVELSGVDIQPVQE